MKIKDDDCPTIEDQTKIRGENKIHLKRGKPFIFDSDIPKGGKLMSTKIYLERSYVKRMTEQFPGTYKEDKKGQWHDKKGNRVFIV